MPTTNRSTAPHQTGDLQVMSQSSASIPGDRTVLISK